MEHVAAVHLDAQLGAEQEDAGELPVQGVDLLWRRAQALRQDGRNQRLDAARRLLRTEIKLPGARAREHLAHYHNGVDMRLLHRLKIYNLVSAFQLMRN